MRTSLAVKYRPKKLTEVCGQHVTVEILKRVIENKAFNNCLLFAGQSGAGKTTLARIFANEINNGLGEPIELDCASMGNVDSIRSIIESAYERSLDSEYKVFILDECHAISSAGWQAFLKCIEEPPVFTIFIFCTTEPHKIPATILNRVQRYNITRIPTNEIYDRLLKVCEMEGFINYQNTCELISKLSNGCMRDALTMLDQCSDLTIDLSIEKTKQLLGDISYEVMLKLTSFIKNKDEAKIFAVIESLYSSGVDLKQFISLYLDFSLDLAKYLIFNAIEATALPSYLIDNIGASISLKAVIQEIPSIQWLNNLIDKLLSLKVLIKLENDPKSTIEAYLIQFCRTEENWS